MRFAHYISLMPAAKAAFDKGNGKHGEFTVTNDKHLSFKNSEGKTTTLLIVKAK